MKMTGTLRGFARKGTPCDPKANSHVFKGSVCECGRVRLTGRYVGKDLSVATEVSDV